MGGPLPHLLGEGWLHPGTRWLVLSLGVSPDSPRVWGRLGSTGYLCSALRLFRLLLTWREDERGPVYYKGLF